MNAARRLNKDLASTVKAVRWRAAVEVVREGALSVAVGLLTHQAPHAREAAAAAAAAIAPTGSRAAPLRRRRAREANPWVSAVLEQGPEHPLAQLLAMEAALDVPAWRRRRVVDALQKGQEQLLTLWRQEDPAVALIALEWLESMLAEPDRRVFYWSFDPWLRTLIHAEGAPWVPWAALRAFPQHEVGKEDARAYRDRLVEHFGEALVEPARREVQVEQVGMRHLWMQWLTQQGLQDTALLVPTLDSRLKAERLEAVRGLIELGEEALPAIWPLLEGGRKARRLAAATVCEELPSADSIPRLEEALEAERTEDGRQALRWALLACQQAGQAPELPELYDLDAEPDANTLLTGLRAMLYEGEPGFDLWLRICNQVERFRALDALDLAADYALGHGVDRWSTRVRPLPHCWRGHEALEALAGRPGKKTWVPVHFLLAEEAAAWFEAALQGVEASARALGPQHLDLFRTWLKRIWRWCARHNFPIQDVELRVDGGLSAWTGFGRAQTTTLELQRGFGVLLHRTAAEVSGASGAPAGLRRARASVDVDHPIRRRVPELVGRTYLDFVEVLG